VVPERDETLNRAALRKSEQALMSIRKVEGCFVLKGSFVRTAIQERTKLGDGRRGATCPRLAPHRHTEVRTRDAAARIGEGIDRLGVGEQVAW